MLDSLSLPRLDIWRKANWNRKAQHFTPTCCIIARLKIVDKDFWIDGAVLSITPQSALFRDASTYLLIRHNEEVMLEIEGEEYRAVITSTDAHGYRLEFTDILAESLIADLNERWRIEA